MTRRPDNPPRFDRCAALRKQSVALRKQSVALRKRSVALRNGSSALRNASSVLRNAEWIPACAGMTVESTHSFPDDDGR